MLKLLVRHWRGEEGLIQSCLVNGGFVGLMVKGWSIFLASALSIALIGGIPITFLIPYALVLQVRLKNFGEGALCANVLVLPFAVWAVWACVGAFRAGLRNASGKGNSRTRQFAGRVAVVWAVSVFGIVMMTMLWETYLLRCLWSGCDWS
jgi:hypothetical protein